jgi:predicted transcriptional regulator
MRNPITPLGGTEMEVLRLVWERNRATAREVHDAMEHRVAYTTVATVIKNLANKGYLSIERDGATFVYSAARAPEEVRGSLLSSVVDKVFGGSARTLIQTLAGHESLTDTEQAEVQRLLAQLGGEPGDRDA